MGEFVRIDMGSGSAAAVATIRLDRPPMNALNAAVQEELREAAIEVTVRDDVRAVVLYGGPKVFAAGADIREMAELSYAAMVGPCGPRCRAPSSSWRASPSRSSPRSAATRWAAGCELALTADFRVLGDNARLGQPEILLGVIPGAGGTQRLSRLVGPAPGEGSGLQRPARPGRRGPVDRPCHPGRPARRRLRRGGRGWRSGSPTVRRSPCGRPSAAIDDGLQLPLDEALRLETALFSALFATEDQQIGMRSFLESGPGQASFVGR